MNTLYEKEKSVLFQNNHRCTVNFKNRWEAYMCIIQLFPIVSTYIAIEQY